MGEVYLAVHPRLPRHDALKVLTSAVQDDPSFRVRFDREAEIAATLENSIVKNAVDTPIKMIDVHGGLSTVAMLHRDKAETGSLIHERATETYYILHGSGSVGLGGSPSDPTSACVQFDVLRFGDTQPQGLR